ncbi:ATP synthase subunit b, mitochondrial-like [Sitophilus oryzae]|uniref:ATP synthase subunit b n=1 Tax=Sitophilus oryzae TaxID=7048 RepID=A0A6J2YGN7_SITOR|nr:ATP synthase subunit b, mitochondrial-like [Sitophilus oryzae]
MLSSQKYISRNPYVRSSLINFYCSDKKKDKADLLKSTEVITENYDQCSEFEDKVLRQVFIEKGKEAVLQSNLSKECRTLFNAPLNKIRLGKNVSIHLEQIPINKERECINWETYNFDQLQGKLLEPGTCTTVTTINPPTIEVKENLVIENKKIEKQPSGGGGGNNTGALMINRPIRQEPGKVIFKIIPVEWWHTFFSKTGVTGFGTFLFTFGTYLISKEIYVLEHYYYHGLGALCMWIGFIKYVGPHTAKWLDKGIDDYEKSCNEGRVEEKKYLEDSIVNELFMQYQSAGQAFLIDAKRENVQLQLEEEYRKRQMQVYQEVKKRLNYQVELVNIYKRIQQRNLVEYVTREVSKAITPEMQDKLIHFSIDQIVEEFNKGGKK